MRIRYISCVMPETTQFKVHELEELPKEPGTVRVLVVAGNMSHFASDINRICFEYWLNLNTESPCTHWDHIIYVPGPFEYGKGTIDMGDDRCEMLNMLAPGKLIVMGSSESMVQSVYFDGPGVRFVGAACWPKQAAVYQMSRVFEIEGSGHKTALDAVGANHTLRAKTANKKLRQDAQCIINTLKKFEDKSSDEVRVVVTYGCPAEVLASEIKGNGEHPFSATVKMGSKEDYDYLARHVDYWIYGALGDKNADTIAKGRGSDVHKTAAAVGKERTTMFVRNHYLQSRGHFEVEDSIFVNRQILAVPRVQVSEETK